MVEGDLTEGVSTIVIVEYFCEFLVGHRRKMTLCGSCEGSVRHKVADELLVWLQ